MPAYSPNRIALFAHSHPAFSKGGGEVAAYNSFRTLVQDGYDALLFSGIWQADPGITRIFYEGEHLLEYAPREYLYPVRKFDGFVFSQLDTRVFPALAAKLREHAPELFHLHHFYNVGTDLALFLMNSFPEARFALTLHEMMAICHREGQMVRTRQNSLCSRATDIDCQLCFPQIDRDRFRARREFLKSFLARFDVLISPSEFLAERFWDWGLEKDIHVLENGYKPVADEISLPADPSKLTRRFALFGQPTPYKGLDLFVTAVNRCVSAGTPGLSFSIYGCTQERFLKQFGPKWGPVLDRLGRNLTFHGVYEPGDVIKLMRQNGWIVVPSIWWENSPVVIQEAFLAGRPPIVADIGGMREKVGDQVDGLHFSARDPTSLADVMLTAAGNQDLWQRLRQNRQAPPTTHETNRELINLLMSARP